MIGWQLSGIDARRWRIRRASLWRPPVTVRRSTVVIPGQHGVTGAGLPVFDEPTVSLTLMPTAVMDQDELEGAANELTAILSAPDLTLTRTSGDLVTTARAALVSINPGRFLAAQHARFTVALAIPGVFLHGPTTTTDLGTVSHSDMVEVPGLGVGTAPVTDATLRVRGPATMVRVYDEATGTGIEWSGSLSSSQYLYLHPDTLTARRSTSTSAWTSGGTNVTSGVDYPPAGVLQAWPVMAEADPADRHVRLRVEGSGFGSSTSLAVRAAPAYL